MINGVIFLRIFNAYTFAQARRIKHFWKDKNKTKVNEVHEENATENKIIHRTIEMLTYEMYIKIN